MQNIQEHTEQKERIKTQVRKIQKQLNNNIRQRMNFIGEEK